MKRKRKLLAALMSAVCLAAAAVPSSVVFADGEKVVTLGANLDDAQKQAILRYFGIEGQNLRTLTITNQDERDHLGSYVPLEQIGTRTYSCALVKPTTSGGIQVKTANLTWVTSNMIASTLSTSGVVNCEVLAASPFEVSGTGALTGILMAYESAVGTPLDESKKEVATQELVTTATVANNIGQQQAANIVNETKIQVIQGRVIDEQQITDIVEEVAQEQDIALSEDDRQLITDLLENIAEQEYNYEEMKDTLERVENNLESLTMQNETAAQQIEGSGTIDTTPEDPVNPETEPETLAQDSILMGTDDSALGDFVVFDATNEEAMPEETQAAETQPSGQEDGGIVIPPPTDVYQSPDSDTGNSDMENSGMEENDADEDGGNWFSDLFSGGSDSDDSEYQIPDGTTDVYPPADQNDGGALPEQNGQDSGEQSNDSSEDDGGWFSDWFTSDKEDDGADVPAENMPAEDGWTDMPEENIGDTGDAGMDMPAENTGDAGDAGTDMPGETVIPLTDLRFVEVTSNATNYEPLPAGLGELTICFTGDYVPGTGTLTVSRSYDGSVFDTVSASDSSRVRVEPISDSGLLGQYGWETGWQMVIALNNPLEANESFYVTFTEDMLTSADGTAHSEALEDTENWCISTLADGLVVDRTSPFLTAGTTVTGYILMDTDFGAVSASVSDVDPAVASFDVTEFSSEAPGFNLTLNGAGTTTFPITYFDAEGNSIDTVNYTLTVR